MRVLIAGLWVVAAYSMNASATPPSANSTGGGRQQAIPDQAPALGVVPGGILVSPVRVDLHPGRRAEAVVLTNTGTSRRTIEVQAMRWTQIDGDDRYEPTHELLANPTRFSLEPGASQTVRIGRPSSAPAVGGSEQAYRVYFQELDAEPTVGQGLMFALRIGVPVFVLPAAAVQPQVDWALSRESDGGLRLRARNRGNQHARLADLRLKDASGGEWPLDGFRYVLPGQWQEWRMPPGQAPRQLLQRLAVLTENGRTEHDIAADVP